RDVGYRCSTGPLVWNRRAEDLDARASASSVPVIWAADIDGGCLHRDRSRDRLRYLRVRPGDDRYLVSVVPAVLVQRTTAPEQARRLVAAELTPQVLADWGGRVIIENHVNVLRPTAATPLLSRATLTRVLSSAPLDRVMRSISGSVAVSAYELESLPLPSATTLADWDKLPGEELEAAISETYRGACS
ncbi:MAG: SAM-dependent methyltransferase, partial [Actinomycetota bacterium]|nr:SAM-dependent methyltransferase [Actinomycetota bacterium]